MGLDELDFFVVSPLFLVDGGVEMIVPPKLGELEARWDKLFIPFSAKFSSPVIRAEPLVEQFGNDPPFLVPVLLH